MPLKLLISLQDPELKAREFSEGLGGGLVGGYVKELDTLQKLFPQKSKVSSLKYVYFACFVERATIFYMLLTKKVSVLS